MKNSFDNILNEQNADKVLEQYMKNKKKVSSTNTKKEIPTIENQGEQALEKFFAQKSKVPKSQSAIDSSLEENALKTPKTEEETKKIPKKTKIIKTTSENSIPKAPETPDTSSSKAKEVETEKKESPKKEEIKKEEVKKEEAKKEEKPFKEPKVIKTDSGNVINAHEVPPIQLDIYGNVADESSTTSDSSFEEQKEQKEHKKQQPKSQTTVKSTQKTKVRKATVKVKPDNLSKLEHKFDVLINLMQKVTFNGNYQRLLKVSIGLSVVVFVLLITFSFLNKESIVKNSNNNTFIDKAVNFNVNGVVSPQHEQNDIYKEESVLLMEKAVNEGKPANYYVLLNQYSDLLKKSSYKKSENEILLEKLMFEVSPDDVKSYNINGRYYPANAVISAWSIETPNKAVEEKLKKSMKEIRVAIETAFYNKDKGTFSDKKANEEIVSFAVERVIGEKLKVNRILIKGDFK